MYCETCDVDDVDDGLAEYRGLGLVPAVIAAPLVAKGTSVATGLVSKGVSAIGNLFGGGPDDTPSGWEREALTGRVRCPTGGKMKYDYLDPSRRIPGHPGYRAGQFYGASVEELEAALEQTPQGRPGDAMFTREALYGVLKAVAPSVPRPSSLRELAQAAVYIAHGKGDCVIGSSESPVAEHIDAILSRYRATSATVPSVDADLASSASAAPLPELGELARRNPLATIGILAALAVGGSLLASSFER